MKKIAWWAMSTITACALLLGYHTSQPADEVTTAAYAPLNPGTSGADGNSDAGTSPTSTAASSDDSASGSTTSSASGATTGGDVSTSGFTGTATTDGTFTGTSVNTRFGPVQVQITVSGGQMTAADAIVYPNSDGKDVMINSRAIPVLSSEAVSAQSATIDSVSGATYTSQAYMQSLQSALDQAGIS